MRNLKKTLCLVLALVFVLGLCTVGAASVQFDDKNEILYTDAVNILSGLGILEGDDRDYDGKMEFRPKDGLSRAEAAKIIAFTVAGPSIDNWPSRQVFDDVPADHWAAKYISYCYYNGIINGVGNNKFDPEGKVTLIAVAKMLLASCGYGAKDEFIGPDWDSNVTAIAMQTKILQGLVGSFDGEANREETALLAYNTMMNVIQVVLSNNTNSYVPVSINGVSSVTLADTVWSLKTSEGVVVANKSNNSSAKGTVLDGVSGVSYFVTDEDQNPALLGHQVRITYRLEGEGTLVKYGVAYFIVDESIEVTGAVAAKTNDAAKVYTFNNGSLESNALPIKSLRSTVSGIFVLDKQGNVLAYRTQNFFVSVLAVNQITGAATVVEPSTGRSVEVTPPTGGKNGDVVTVSRVGDVYTASSVPTARVKIYAETPDKENGCYIYNDGAVVPSKAEMLNTSTLPFTPLNNYNRLEVGSTYTLYYDSEGRCLGFSDKTGSGSVSAATDFVLLVTTFTKQDDYGTTGYYAQVIKQNGERANLAITKATFDSLLDNNVYKLSVSGSYANLTAPTSDEVVYEKYSTADPTTMFDQATFIWYNGTLTDLTVQKNQRPLAGSYVFYVYAYEREGTVNVRRIKTVWFQTSNTNPVPVSNSYIFLVSTAIYGTRLVDGVVRNFYNGYRDGEEMTDLVMDAAPASVGFVTYSRSTSGVYSILSYVENGNGTKTGVRQVTLIDEATDEAFLLSNQLWLVDNKGNQYPVSLSSVKYVVVGDAATSGLTLDSYKALQNAMLAGKKITVTFVEVVSGSSHSIAGNALYVTEVK